ncbi:hypothetical protein DUI87_21324 [Hirundo rustica rustica]|uniref:Uncharacterized protein n=1 Tax=Hirundo rustica rustica TaxID=333673 RepID=A0A3M0K515_HIRRU|nr:hypothetical protein DUI87_21324 [Hirundo rustica rustica]
MREAAAGRELFAGAMEVVAAGVRDGCRSCRRCALAAVWEQGRDSEVLVDSREKRAILAENPDFNELFGEGNVGSLDSIVRNAVHSSVNTVQSDAKIFQNGKTLWTNSKYAEVSTKIFRIWCFPEKREQLRELEGEYKEITICVQTPSLRISNLGQAFSYLLDNLIFFSVTSV